MPRPNKINPKKPCPFKKGGYNFEERKEFWDSFFDFKAPKLRLPVKIAKRSGCKL